MGALVIDFEQCLNNGNALLVVSKKYYALKLYIIIWQDAHVRQISIL